MKINRVFYQFFYSYLVVLLIPLVLLVFIYFQTFNLIEDTTSELNKTVLEETKNNLEKQFEQLHTTMMIIEMNPRIKEIQRYKIEDKKKMPSTIYLTWRDVQSYGVSIDFINNMYIYFNQPQITISRNTSYLDVEKFYPSFLSYESISLDKWLDDLSNSYHRKLIKSKEVIIDGVNKEVITYIQSLPISLPTKPLAQVVVLIDVEKVEELFEPLKIYEDVKAYILDENDEVIFSLTNDVMNNIDEEKYLYTEIISEYNGLKYFSYIPKDQVYKKVSYLKKIVIAYYVLVFILGIIFSYIISKKKTQPISSLLKDIEEETNQKFEAKDPYELFHNTLDTLYKDKHARENVLKKQCEILKSQYIEKILEGKKVSKESITLLNEKTKKFFLFTHFVVVQQRFITNAPENEQMLIDISVSKETYIEFINSILPEYAVLNKSSEEYISIIFGFDFSSYDEMLKRIYKFLEKANEYDFSTIIGIGALANSIDEIYRSSFEAKEAVNYNRYSNKQGVCRFSEIVYDDAYFYYPIEIEEKIMQLVLDCDIESVEELLKKIYTENILNRELTASMYDSLRNSMKSTLFRLLQMISTYYEDASSFTRVMKDKIEGEKDILVFLRNVKSFYIEMVSFIEAKKNSEKNKLCEKMERIVLEEYSNDEMSLKYLSSKLNKNEVYLSKLFKETKKETFSKFLEKIRMKEASYLLLNSNKTISEITNKVGYNNPHVFRRAFKRVYATTPTKYVENHKKKNS